ncbi:MAG: DUF4388 domain-containing protein [Acidimicrobiia bacterium]
MALSGNLGFVPLDEVLRLLMRSDQRGAVEIRGEDIRGRIFVGKKGITLATTSEDRDLHAHLVNSGYVDDAFLRKVVAGDATFSDLAERETPVIELLREITVESLYHMKQRGSAFDVAEGATTPYSSPKPFELEQALDDARRRADEWADVHKVVADLDATIRMNRDPAGDDEIQINREAWRLLCEIGSGASVKAIADRLGTTEFWIARVAADMASQELLIMSEKYVEERRHEPTAYSEPVPADDDDEDVNPNESWWVEPKDEEPDGDVQGEQETEQEIEETPELTDEPAPVEPSQPVMETPEQSPVKESRFGQFLTGARPEGATEDSAQAEPAAEYDENPPAEADETIEEDTEAFLEKVFSQLDVNGQPEEEEEGHGLLRRRRMGSVLKEIDED